MTDMAARSDGSTLQTPLRIDQQGRVLCSAYSNRTGELCRGPAMHGQTKCRAHGAGAPQSRQAARVRLLELVGPAVETLADLLLSDDESTRLKAANSILDRAGHARSTRIEAEDARALLVARILAWRETEAEAIEAGPDGAT